MPKLTRHSIRERRRAGMRWVYSLLLPLCLAAVLGACHERPAPLSADLTVDFHCSVAPRASRIVRYLQSRRFMAVDQETPRGREGVHYFPLQIDAYDSHRVVVGFVGLSEPPSRSAGINYQLTVLGPPPTHHDVQLQRDLVAFVRNALRCSIARIQSSENSIQSSAQFNRFFAHKVLRMHVQLACSKRPGQRLCRT